MYMCASIGQHVLVKMPTTQDELSLKENTLKCIHKCQVTVGDDKMRELNIRPDGTYRASSVDFLLAK